MTQKITNPFISSTSYNCFGCAPSNPIGLKLHFELQDDWLQAQWQPSKEYEGWENVLHGGIQATLLDEIASWIVFVKLKTAGVTSRLEMKFHHPVAISDETITIRARLTKMKRNIAVIEAMLMNRGGIICSSAVFHYFTFPPEKATDKLRISDDKAILNNPEREDATSR